MSNSVSRTAQEVLPLSYMLSYKLLLYGLLLVYRFEVSSLIEQIRFSGTVNL